MESTPGKRIQQWREFKKLTATDLHRLTGINVTTISQAENPKGKVSNPSFDTLTKMLAAFPDLNPDWLLLGTGSMLRDGRTLTPKPEPAATHPETETETAKAASAEGVVKMAILRDTPELVQVKSERDQLRRYVETLLAMMGGKPTPEIGTTAVGATGKLEASSDAADSREWIDELAAEFPISYHIVAKQTPGFKPSHLQLA